MALMTWAGQCLIKAQLTAGRITMSGRLLTRKKLRLSSPARQPDHQITNHVCFSSGFWQFFYLWFAASWPLQKPPFTHFRAGRMRPCRQLSRETARSSDREVVWGKMTAAMVGRFEGRTESASQRGTLRVWRSTRQSKSRRRRQLWILLHRRQFCSLPHSLRRLPAKATHQFRKSQQRVHPHPFTQVLAR